MVSRPEDAVTGKILLTAFLVWAVWQAGHFLWEMWEIWQNGFEPIPPCGIPLCLETWGILAAKLARKVRKHHPTP